MTGLGLLIIAAALLVGAIRLAIYVGETVWVSRGGRWPVVDVAWFSFLGALCPVLFGVAFLLVVAAFPLLTGGR